MSAPEPPGDVPPGGRLHSGAELAELLGHRPAPKLEFVMLGPRLFHREVDGSWWEYLAQPD